MSFQMIHTFKNSLPVIKIHSIPAVLSRIAIAHDKGDPTQGDQFIIFISELIRPQQYTLSPVCIAFQQSLFQLLITVGIDKPNLQLIFLKTLHTFYIGDPEEGTHSP